MAPSSASLAPLSTVITRASLIRRYKAISPYLLATWSKLRQHGVDIVGATGSIPVVSHTPFSKERSSVPLPGNQNNPALDPDELCRSRAMAPSSFRHIIEEDPRHRDDQSRAAALISFAVRRISVLAFLISAFSVALLASYDFLPLMHGVKPR